jgi:hypothetical protein
MVDLVETPVTKHGTEDEVMRLIYFLVMLCVFLDASGVVATAAPPEDASEGAAVSIGTYRVIHSDVLNEERTLLISVPEEYESGAAAYPVLFVLYGDQVRGYFAETVHTVSRLSQEGSIPALIVVGVANVERYRDLSPVERRGNPSGIEPFSRFVVEELIPFVEKEYRTVDYRILVGPQAGAEFGLYTLAKRPGVFDAFLVENPFRSERTTEVLMGAMTPVLADGMPAYTFIQITCVARAGFMDMTEGNDQVRELERIVADKNIKNLMLVTNFVENNQDFIPSPGVKEGLRELFRDYRFPDEREISGLADLKEHYQALSGRFGFVIDVPELTLITRGVELKEKHLVEAAEEIFAYAVSAYPASVNGYWQLANLYRELNDRERALEYYRKCLEVMPGMRPAQHWIDKLEGGN